MRRFDAWIRSLSGATELIIVVVVAFGWFIVGSVRSFVAALASSHQLPPMTEWDFIELVLQEAFVLIFLGWFLWRRGWTLAQFGLVWHQRPIRKSLTLAIGHQILWGAGLVFCVVLPSAVITPVLQALLPQSVAVMTDSSLLLAPGVGLGVILIVSLLNPIFEEVFLCGYLISKLAPAQGTWFAINVSTAIRFTYHLYQGPIGAISIILVGLIFAYWFAHRRQLWPLIIAHACLDFLFLFAALQLAAPVRGL